MPACETAHDNDVIEAHNGVQTYMGASVVTHSSCERDVIVQQNGNAWFVQRLSDKARFPIAYDKLGFIDKRDGNTPSPSAMRAFIRDDGGIKVRKYNAQTYGVYPCIRSIRFFPRAYRPK